MEGSEGLNSTNHLKAEEAEGAGACCLSFDTEDTATAVTIWSEDIILEPGNVRFPIRIVLVDSNFKTRFDRLVQLPSDTTTHVYRVLDHGIPWQHLEVGLTMKEVKQQVLNICKGKELVMYDSWKTLGLFDFRQEELSLFTTYDLKGSRLSLGANGQPMSYWDLVRSKLNHTYSGKPGNYDTIQLADFLMSIYLKYKEKENINNSSAQQ